MSNKKAYGSITIYDLGDTDKLTLDIEYNQPRDIIYNYVSYNPDFTKNPLILKPIIYLGSNPISTDKLQSIQWLRELFDGSILELTPDVIDGSITINENILTETILTAKYTCVVEYKNLTATSFISFNLLLQPRPISACSILGDSVFLYDSEQKIKGSDTITLEAKLDDCEITEWQYKNALDEWVTIAGSQGETSIDIKASDTYYVADVATIKAVTNAAGVYDKHQIYKVRDGAAGADLLQVALSNEDIDVPCDKDGNLLPGALNQASTSVKVYLGNLDITNVVNISGNIVESDVEGYFDDETKTYKITNVTGLTGKVEFTVSYEGEKTITKTLWVTKVYAGQDGKDPEIFYLHLNTNVINKNKEGNYIPNIIQAVAYKTIAATLYDYSGYIKIYSSNGTEINSDEGKESKHIRDLNVSASGDYKYIIELYSAENPSLLLDSQTVIVVSDGDKGDLGDKGEDSINFILGNIGELIPCDKDGKVANTLYIDIPFEAFKGTLRIPCSAAIEGLIRGEMILSDLACKDSTTDAAGNIRVKILSEKTLNNKDSGVLEITLTTTNTDPAITSTPLSFNWAKCKTGQDGASSVFLSIYTPDGNIINNGENSIKLVSRLIDGVSEVSDYSIEWFVYDSDNADYIQISGTSTSKDLTLSKDNINSLGLYKCIATYNNNEYEAYTQVYDKTDPLLVEIFSTIGDKITNKTDNGYLYAKVYRNGLELDPLQNLLILSDAPVNPATGDVWYQTGSTGSGLAKYTGSSWISFLNDDITEFIWTIIANDASQSETYISSGNFLKIDGSMIDSYNTIHLLVKAKSGAVANRDFYMIDATEAEMLGEFENISELSSYLNLYNIKLKPNHKYRNTTEKKTYIYTTHKKWVVLVEDGENGNNGATPSGNPTDFYARSSSSTVRPSETYTSTFPDYDKDKPYVWKLTREEWEVKDDSGNVLSTKIVYSEPILLSQLDCITQWAASAGKGLGAWCKEKGITIVESGMIATGSITSSELATDAITSSNYDSGISGLMIPPAGNFALSGTFLDLDNGCFYSKNLYVTENTAKFFGSIESKDYSVSDSGTTISGFKLSSDDGDLLIDSPNLKVDQSGNIEGNNCHFTDGNFIGHIEADTGNIGDFKIQNGSLESDHIVLKPESIYFPTQSVFNLSNDVSIYNEETVSYIATDGNRDLELKNLGGAGIRFKANSLQDTVLQSINITDAKIRNEYMYEEIDADASTDWYDFYIDFNWSISNNSTLFSPKTVTFYVKYTHTAPGVLWKPDTITDYTFTVNLDIPARVGSGSESRYVCKANSPDLLEWHGITKDANASNASCSFNTISFSEIAVSAKNNTLYSLGSFCPNVPDGSSNVTTYVLGNDSHIWQSIRALTASITSSDARLKNNINKLNDKYSILFDRLQPVSYKYNDNTSNRTHTGFIAQEVEEAIKESGLTTQDFAGICIGNDENKTYALRYEEFISLCVNEIQKLKFRVKELEEQLLEK